MCAYELLGLYDFLSEKAILYRKGQWLRPAGSYTRTPCTPAASHNYIFWLSLNCCAHLARALSFGLSLDGNLPSWGLAWMNSHHRYRFSYRCTPVGTSSWDWDEKGQARFSSFLPIAPVVIIFGLGQGMIKFWSCVWSKTYETTLQRWLSCLTYTRTLFRPTLYSSIPHPLHRYISCKVLSYRKAFSTKFSILFVFSVPKRKRSSTQTRLPGILSDLRSDFITQP